MWVQGCRSLTTASAPFSEIDNISPDASDVSPEPEFSGDHDEIKNMAESLKDGTPAAKTESNASGSSQDQHTPTNGQSKPNLKDPLRPRRKKARRACYACQRAHLTCGMLPVAPSNHMHQLTSIQGMNDRVSGASNEAYKINAAMECGRRQNIFMMLQIKL